MPIQFTAPVPKSFDLDATVPMDFTLPLATRPDSVRWQIDPVGCLELQANADDPSKVRLSVHPGASVRFVVIKYTIDQAGEQCDGMCTVRVMERQTVATPASRVVQSPAPTPPRPSIMAQGSAPTENAVSRPDLEVSGAIDDNCQQLLIQVLDESATSIREELTIVRGRTYTLGRSSSSAVRNPNFVMDRHFASGAHRKNCSRHQASILWEGNQVSITTSGRKSIFAIDEQGQSLEMPEKSIWMPGKILAIPGGVRLRLVAP